MTGESSALGRGGGRRPWGVVVAVLLLLVGGVVWGVLSQHTDASSATVAQSEFNTPTPQPTEFQAPSPGSTAEVTKPVGDVEVALDQPAPAVGDVVVDVAGLAAGSFTGALPGETSGDSITVSVRVRNDGSAPIDTAGSSVALFYGGDERTPAIQVAAKDARTWPTSIAAGSEATADFTFVAPLAVEGDIRVTVDLLASAPDIVFVGARP